MTRILYAVLLLGVVSLFQMGCGSKDGPAAPDADVGVELDVEVGFADDPDAEGDAEGDAEDSIEPDLGCDTDQCREPAPCIADAFEPNDTLEDAAELGLAPVAIEASICGADVDYFAIDFASVEGAEGTLVIALIIADEDVGNAQLHVEVYGPESTFIAEELVPEDGHLSLSFDRPEGVEGRHIVVIRDLLTFAPEGTRYALAISFTPSECVPGEGDCQPPEAVICSPGEHRCGEGGVEVCDAGGRAYVLIRHCPFGCESGEGLPTCVAPENDECKTAHDIIGHDILDMGGSFAAHIEDYGTTYDPLDGGCTGGAAPGADAVFFVDADAGDVISASLRSDFDAHLWVTLDCTHAAQTCVSGVASGAGAREILQFEAQVGGRYYLIVDAADVDQTGLFELDVQVELPMCPPYTVLGCANETTLSYCTALGAPLPYRCDGGCWIDTCGLPSGDQCFDAVPVFDGDVVSGPFQGSNGLAPGAEVIGNCDFRDGSGRYLDGPVGPDRFYAIDMRAGQTLHVTGQHNSQAGVFYIVEDCRDASTCVDANLGQSAVDLTYFADEDRTVYVVAGSLETQSVTLGYTLEFDLFEAHCEPGARRCVDEDRAAFCLPQGYWEETFCEAGCGEDDRCHAPSGDTCGEAIPLVHLDRVRSNLTGTNALVAGKGERRDCDFGWDDQGGGEGPDRFFVVDLEEGQRLEVEVISDVPAIVYLLETCGQMNSCVANSLLSESHRFTYRAPKDQTLYIVVDATMASVFRLFKDFDLRITIEEPQDPPCDLGATRCMEDQETLGVCEGGEFYATFACPGSCTDGRCEPASGLVCQDAIVMNSGETITNFVSALHTLPIDPAQSGACDFTGLHPEQLEGPTTIYAVDVVEGQRLHARLDSVLDTLFMFVFEDCNDGASSCLARSDVGPATELVVDATRSGTLYLVVTRTLPQRSMLTYDLTVFTYWRECTPGERTCLDDGTTLLACSPDGLPIPYRCEGECDGGECTLPRGETCFDPIEVSAPAVVSGTFDGTDSLAPGPGQVGTCDFGSAVFDGRDTIYRVFVFGGTVLSAALTTDLMAARLYFLQDCGDLGSCITATSSADEVGRIFVAEDQWIHIVVDAVGNIPNSTVFELEVTVEVPDCIPGQERCGATPGTVERCIDFGVFTTFSCSSGSCDQGGCVDPGGDVCHEPILLTDGAQITDTFGAVNAINPGTGSFGQCESSWNARGPERVYAIDLEAGQNLAARLVAPDSNTLFYLMTDCLQADSCVDFALTRDLEVILYHRAQVRERVYIVVDHRFSSGSLDTFDLAVSVGEAVCVPDTLRCSEDGGLDRCNQVGLWLPHGSCNGGCSEGRCVDPLGDFCGDGISLTMGQTSSGNLAHWAMSIHRPAGFAGDCVFPQAQQAPDRIYSVELLAGQVLKVAFVTSDPATTASIWESCFDPQTCRAAGSALTGATELFYAAQVDGTVDVVIDGTGTYEIAIDIEWPSCDAIGSRRCASDGETAQVCNAFGVYTSIACEGGCFQGYCVTPRGDDCSDAIMAASKDVFYGDWTGTNRLSAPDGDAGLCGLAFSETTGPETFYAIELFSGEVLRAELETELETARLYLIGDCRDLATCQAEAGTEEEGTLFYAASTHEVLYLVVDKAGYEASQASYNLTVDVEPLCMPGQTRCAGADVEEICNAAGAWSGQACAFGCRDGQCLTTAPCEVGEVACLDENTLSYCDADGLPVEYPCQGGCAVHGCAEPRGDVCPDAIVATGGGVFAGNFATLTNAVDPLFGGCTGFDAPGPEGIYRVELDAGQRLSAVLSNLDGANDLSLYIVEDCFAAASSCLVGADAYGTTDESVTYRADEATALYVIADAWNADASGTYQLLITVED